MSNNGTKLDRIAYMEATITRFWSKVNKNGPNGCWLWTGTLHLPNHLGLSYGSIGITREDGRSFPYRAHRFSYLLHKGAIPDGLLIMHKCDNPACVNPDHLEAGTLHDNFDDHVLKGRKPMGENCTSSKLKEADVIEILRSTEKHVVIAKRFGIHPSYVGRLRQGRKWKHLHGELPARKGYEGDRER